MRDDNDVHAEMLRTSLAAFAADMLSGPPEAPYYGKFLIGPHHEEWSDIINRHDRICLEAPRDHGKTKMCTVAYNIWMAWKNPGRLGYIFSESQPLAEERLGEIVEELETNPKLERLHPQLSISRSQSAIERRGPTKKWAARHITLANGTQIRARGLMTKIRGGHPLWINCDDIIGDESGWSSVTRNRATTYFLSRIENMVVPGGQIVVIGTPQNASDLYGYLEGVAKRTGRYFFKRYPAINNKGEALWPDRYSIESLEKKRQIIGEVQFTRELMCVPIADDMSLFPNHLFEGDPVEQYQLTLGMKRSHWAELGVQIFIAVDFAISSSTKADYTVIWIVGLDRFGNRWIIDIFRDRGMSYEAQKSKIVEYGRLYRPDLILLESNQMQRIWGDQLIQETDLPIRKFITTSEKNSLEKGIPGMRVILENKKYRIPRGDERSVELTNVWKAEMQSFAFIDGKVKSVGEHDDVAMASYIGEQAVKMGSQGFYESTESIEADIRRESEEKSSRSITNQHGDPDADFKNPDDAEEDVDDVFTGESLKKKSPGMPWPMPGGFWGSR